MVPHQCGFFHEPTNDQTNWMFCQTLKSWMVSHQCGFFQMIGPTELLPLFYVVWILSQGSKWLDRRNLFPLFEQLNGFSSVWILSWVFKWLDWLNFLACFEQLNSSSSVWILSRAYKLSDRIRVATFWLNGFSLLWILSCLKMIALTEFHGTLWAAEWFLVRQTECFVRLWRAKWSLSLISVNSFMSLQMIGRT